MKVKNNNKLPIFVGLIIIAIYMATRSLVTPYSFDFPAIAFAIYIMVIIIELLERTS